MSFDGIKAASSALEGSAFSSFTPATSVQATNSLSSSNNPIQILKMHSNMKFIVCTILLAIIFSALVNDAEATYRKPPFNGSIFGKRGSTVEYDSASKALSAMCEIANEACQSWFPTQDNK